MRRLIINADDFGMTSGVNRAIVESHRAGIVTSATLMANEAATAEAIAMAAQNPSLSTGCHVVLVDGRPLSPAARVQSLVTTNGPQASFRPGIAQLAAASVLGKVVARDVHEEAGAQMAALRSRGLNLSHVDCHMHSHILPVVAEAVLQAARENGIGAVRNPFEPSWSVAATHKNTSLRSWNRSAQVSVLRVLRAQFVDLVRQAKMKTTDGTIGVAVTGLLDRNLLKRLIEAIPDGTWELVTHPGYNDQELANATTELKESRSVELQVLTSPELQDLLRRRGVELISYRNL
jgi:hopanoid biosynthesis associated protein HpnK